MKRISVSSSNIASIGYDSNSQILEVEFNNGSIYQYFNVPDSVYQGLMNASSHGIYLNQYVKGTYQYEQIK